TEFARMVAKGAGPSRSAFLSAFFTLVGTHGVHVASGLVALVYLVAQVMVKGLRATVLRRLLCWSQFWHALDMVSVGVFTLVYLMGGHSGTIPSTCSMTGRRASKSMSPRPAICRTRWGWHSLSWRQSLLSSWRRPTCCGPQASRSD